jgi:pyruvate dehydrogenase phosphatase
MDGKLLSEAVAAIEQKFTDVVNDNKDTNPDIMHMGSSCLIALIWNRTLYIANLGDSQVVLGRTYHTLGQAHTELRAIQLSNCAGQFTRVALRRLFPDNTILLNNENGWKFKDLSKVCFFTFKVLLFLLL